MVIAPPTPAQAASVLPAPFGEPTTGDAIRPSPATLSLVRSQAKALLEASPAFHQLPPEQRRELAHNLVKIAAYTAALVHDEWRQCRKLGQTPMLQRERTILQPLATGSSSEPNGAPSAPARGAAASALPARAASDTVPSEEFAPRAVQNVGAVTERTLNAVAFPTFVADLIKGTFRAIVEASIDQMEAYGKLLANVAKTVDQFMAENITDNQARDYLVSSYPEHFSMDLAGEGPRLRVREREERPDFQAAFGLPDPLTHLDDHVAEQSLVPAARRRLARQRHQTLATMVLMGVNRIVVTSGRIQARMGFRIDASDTARTETASQFDLQHQTTYGFGGGLSSLFGYPSLETGTNVAYVSSTKKDTTDEINVQADLTGEVDLRFKSDYFPLTRMATPEMLQLIQGHTPNPAGNPPAGRQGEEAVSTE